MFERRMVARRLVAATWRVAVVRAFLAWLPLAVATTGIALLVAVTAQQVIRGGANEPQLQLAEDAAARLEAGAAPSAVLPADRVDLVRSLAPYVMVFDTAGHLVASSATLDGAAPSYPPGVLANTRGPAGNRITWQPGPGLRFATVAMPWRGGYVVTGRSLREAERR